MVPIAVPGPVDVGRRNALVANRDSSRAPADRARAGQAEVEHLGFAPLRDEILTGLMSR